MTRLRLPALRVKQWLPTWDMASWGQPNAKPMPPNHFYLAAIPISVLRALAGIRPRTKEARKMQDDEPGYQRSHEEERLEKIGRYIQYGYPLSSSGSLKPDGHVDLINPGWLPTAILVNVIASGDTRSRGNLKLSVKPDHLVKLHESGKGIEVDLPATASIDPENELPPLEIIDGQHRLLAVDQLDGAPEDYEVPVVLFDNLSPAWQAYLFWVINVEPKKINTSLAFDLYPELRNQDWLEQGESIKIYQEHRSQELAEVLWRHPKSPWADRIELFGKRVDGHVSNAAAIRSLSATFVRAFPRTKADEDEFKRLGGLFGTVGKGGDQSSFVIGWRRSQQAAYLIHVWTAVRNAVENTKAEWAQALRQGKAAKQPDIAFCGGSSLLATDQGFRCICFVFNAVSQVAHDQLDLSGWYTEATSDPTIKAVDQCLEELRQRKKVILFLQATAASLADSLDWRTSSAPGLTESQQQAQAQYRGSSGYSALNRAAIRALGESKDDLVSSSAKSVLAITGWANA